MYQHYPARRLAREFLLKSPVELRQIKDFAGHLPYNAAMLTRTDGTVSK